MLLTGSSDYNACFSLCQCMVKQETPVLEAGHGLALFFAVLYNSYMDAGKSLTLFVPQRLCLQSVENIFLC